MIVDLKWRVKAPPEPKSLFTRALELSCTLASVLLGASVILFFSFVTVCAVLGVAL